MTEDARRTMAPDRLPPSPGLQLAYRHLPSDAGQDGGHWFDAISLPGGRIALVVGDVLGSGSANSESAAMKGQFRTAVLTLAQLDLPPDQVLRQLDDLARQLGELYLATCSYVVCDPATQTCEVANAGHTPPVLIDPDGRGTLLDLPTGVPIGVGGTRFETVRFAVSDRSRIVLCGDGLIESRGDGTGVSLASLCADYAVAAGDGNTQQALEESCDAIIGALHTASLGDVAVLMACFDGPA